MNVFIECCGATQRWCGAPTIDLDLGDGATVGDLLGVLAARFPDLAARRDTLAVASGDDVVRAAHVLRPGERLALIPPVSGG